MKRFAVLLAIVAVLAATAPAPATARTDTRTKPVVFVHGYNAFGDADADCGQWQPMIDTLRRFGHTGQMATVRYYGADFGCTHAAERYGTAGRHFDPGGAHDRYTRIEHLAYHVAWMIHTEWSSKGITVDVVSHSMGGLITRYALAQVQRRHPDFPPSLLVEDSVTMGTPHGGTGWANFCWTTQCSQMRPGSSFVSWLRTYAPNPQVTGGTDWTAMASYDDEIVSEGSGIDMASAHKVQYLDYQGVSHGDYYVDTTDTRSADVRYADGGAFSTWYDAPWGVRWADHALALGSW